MWAVSFISLTSFRGVKQIRQYSLALKTRWCLKVWHEPVQHVLMPLPFGVAIILRNQFWKFFKFVLAIPLTGPNLGLLPLNWNVYSSNLDLTRLDLHVAVFAVQVQVVEAHIWIVQHVEIRILQACIHSGWLSSEHFHLDPYSDFGFFRFNL